MSHDNQKMEIEAQLIARHYPKLLKHQRRKLARLCREKGVEVFTVNTSALDSVLCSIFRHEDTGYDSMKPLPKWQARAIVQPIVDKKLARAKGIKEGE